LDAHCEAGTLSVPVIDGIQWSDFSINPVYAEGTHSRGMEFFSIMILLTFYY